MSRSKSRRALAALVAVATAAALAGCAGGGGATGPIRLGWSGELPPLDPAASDSAGSFAFLSQIYPSLLRIEAGEAEPVPNLAASAEWTAAGVYEVVLPAGLEFANGDALTTSDVKFSIERQLALQSEDGAWRQLSNLDSVEIVDPTTIRFHLGAESDARFPFVLAGPAGLVLDEEVFFADELTPDDDIVGAEPFAGPFALTSTRGDVRVLRPYRGYGGSRSALSTLEVHPGDDDALAQRLRDGSIDVITGRLSLDTLTSLADDDDVELTRAASGRVRMLAFDFAYMPFGARTEAPDAAKAAAIRAAIAGLVDREELAGSIGGNWIEPLYGYLPDGIPGAADVFDGTNGESDDPDDDEALDAALLAAGIVTPIALSIHVDLDQVGPPGSAEVAALATQLDDSGLFTVTVVETDAAGYGAALLAGEVQAVFTSVLPSNADPLEYLTPFRSASPIIPGFASTDIDALLARQIGELDPDVRARTVLETENAIVAALPAIPITQGVRVVFSRSVISGVRLDDSHPLDLARLRR